MHAISDGPEDSLLFLGSMCMHASYAFTDAREKLLAFQLCSKTWNNIPYVEILKEVNAGWQFLECP